MCEPTTTGLIISAIGGGAKYANTQASLKRKDRQAAAGIRRQGRIQEESNRKVSNQIEDFGRSTGREERAESLQGFIDALRAADEETTGALPGVPGANQRFAESVAAGRSKLGAEGSARADRLSRIDAPRLQRINEAGRVGRTASELGEQMRRSRAEEFLTKLRVASERPNEFINALASVAQGVGTAMSMGAGSGASMSQMYNSGTLVDAPVRASTSGVFI